MPTLDARWMKLAACLTLMLPVIGCANIQNGRAICDGTKTARINHAAALVKDGGNLSVVTGANLIQLIEAGCGEGQLD